MYDMKNFIDQSQEISFESCLKYIYCRQHCDTQWAAQLAALSPNCTLVRPAVDNMLHHVTVPCFVSQQLLCLICRVCIISSLTALIKVIFGFPDHLFYSDASAFIALFSPSTCLVHFHCVSFNSAPLFLPCQC